MTDDFCFYFRDRSSVIDSSAFRRRVALFPRVPRTVYKTFDFKG